MPNTVDFEKALEEIFQKAEALGLVAIEVNSGNLHRRVGGYPGRDHRMPICCDVMYSQMNLKDTIVAKPERGKGASVVIRYICPRRSSK